MAGGGSESSSSSSSSVKWPKTSFKTRVDAASRSAVGVLTVEAGDVLLRASCTDDTFVKGPSLQGLALGVEKPGSFVFEYDVGAKAPKFQFMSTAKVGTRLLSLSYSHQQHIRNSTTVEGTFTVDPRNEVACSYDFSSQSGRIKYAYAHDDRTVLDSAFDFGNKAWDFSASRKISEDDSVKASYRGSEKALALDWTRMSTDGGGPFKVYADVPLTESKTPRLMMEKTWNC